MKDNLVELALSKVDYSSKEKYVPTEYSLRLINLFKLIDPNLEHTTPIIHYMILDGVTKPGNTINMCFRGSGKTTLQELMIWDIAIFKKFPHVGRVDYGLYVSDCKDNGVKTMQRALADRYDKSPFLQKCIPGIKLNEGFWKFTNESGESTVFTGHGAQTGVRGTQNLGTRPNIALLDDLMSDKVAKSPTCLENITNTVYSAVLPALHPTKRKIIWNGTPFNESDPLYSSANSGSWNVNVFPVCEKFPTTREEFSGAWNDRFTFDSVKATYNDMLGSGKSDAFYRELMVNIISTDLRLIQPEDVKWFNLHEVTSRIYNYNIYVTTDFAVSNKNTADYSVISVWAYDEHCNWYYIDGVMHKQGMERNLDELFRFTNMYDLVGVGIEVSGQQEGLVSLLTRFMIDNNTFFPIVSDGNQGRLGIRPSTKQSKIIRFSNIVPFFKAGKIHFPVELKQTSVLLEGLHEIELATRYGFKSKNDDFVDTISMLLSMNPSPPSLVDENQQHILDIYEDDDDYNCYESYLGT